MEIKKNNKFNLEKFKLNFLAIGLIISILFVLTAFQYESINNSISDFNMDNFIEEEEMVEITRNDIEPPKPIERNQTVIIPEIIEIVENHVEVDTNTVVWTEEIPILEIDTIQEEEPEIFFHVQVMPKFPGGPNALLAYIYKHVRYPAIARENDIQGTVYLRFEVTKTGNIGQIVVQKSPDPLLEEAAVNVIKKLPKFKPGFQNGKYVSVWYSLPVTFKLQY